MKRSPLRSDPIMIRAWQDRSRKPLRRSKNHRVRWRTKIREYEKVRAEVLDRDGGRCQASAIAHECDGRAVHCHHVIPRGRGGLDEAWNLIGVCAWGHLAIHEHPADATRLGLLAHRPSIG